MVLPAQFQLGLELTNIVNPISQAVSAVGSLALIDAIRKSGSDTITEMKLASFIGRHLIDPAIKLHFREAVAKSDQSVISRYMDIILESGSGPTVQEAMKNPALFSMVIQLSGLAFAHEDESLAGAIVEAMERIVRDSGADVAIVPDYMGLLGTLRACQQQTAAFRWASVYEAVEHKIQQTITAYANEGSPTNRSAKRRKSDLCSISNPPGVGARSLPFPVLQSLLMWLHSLQKFPEHRLLHLRCNSGVSTVVVWCYHVLGMSVKVVLSGTSICFGKEPSNILIEEVSLKDVAATLMDPAEQHEPLFTLAMANGDPEIGYEDRAEAYGFGQFVLKAAGLTEAEEHYCSQAIIAFCMKHPEYENGLNNSHKRIWNDSMIRAGKFLFSLEAVDIEALRKYPVMEFEKSEKFSRIRWPRLANLLFTFARIKEHDLERCNSMSLSLSAYHAYHSLYASSLFSESKHFSLSISFQYLAYLLLGHMFSEEYVADAVLVSAWGWSIFFDIFDAADPSDASNTIRVMGGVPSRRGVRRARIIDGPTDNTISSEVVLKYSKIDFAPGVSTGKRGITMVGYHSDAFQITQTFTWTPENKTGHGSQKFGFRQMQELCLKTKRVPSCQCESIKPSIVKQLDAYDGRKTIYYELRHSDERNMDDEYMPRLQFDRKKWFTNEFLFYSVPLQASGHPSSSSERLMARRRLKKDRLAVEPAVESEDYFFYLSDNAAARWLGLQFMCAEIQDNQPHVYMRGFDTCLRCAMEYLNSKFKFPLRILL